MKSSRRPAREPAPTLPRQEADFTAEGAPAPGLAGLQVPEGDDVSKGPSQGEAAAAPSDDGSSLPGRPAHIVGAVESRQGDGVNFRLRKGPCTVHLTALDATIDWRDGDFSGRTSMPLPHFDAHLRSGALVFDDAPAAT